jgi:hypothetical protein
LIENLGMSLPEIPCYTYPDVFESIAEQKLIITYYSSYPEYFYVSTIAGKTFPVETKDIDSIIKLLVKIKDLGNQEEESSSGFKND